LDSSHPLLGHGRGHVHRFGEIGKSVSCPSFRHELVSFPSILLASGPAFLFRPAFRWQGTAVKDNAHVADTIGKQEIQTLEAGVQVALRVPALAEFRRAPKDASM
jgi:REP element-mobilizing transposase RayT